jgi:beta-galactosidase
MTLLVFCLSDVFSQVKRHTFSLGDKEFLLDAQPFQIIAGEMHFSRIPKEYWRHRIQMARAMGLNTIATYVFWNYHEPRPREFDFETENRDIAAFVKMVQEEGMWVIIRPGPYACAEWEFGGFPWWLLKEKDLVVRGKDSRFLRACERYIFRLGREIGPLQVTRGGPIIMVQIENEYGSFGNDKGYVGKLRDMALKAGFDVPLFTADGPYQCKDGCIQGVLPAINGEENPKSLRDTVSKYNGGKGPYFTPEFYPGWLDNWGLKHNIVPVEDFIGKYDALLTDGISVSLYMFHGGTSFGFMNGANYNREYPILPQTTTYDYDSPLDEAGRPMPKYFRLREVIARHLGDGFKIPAPPRVNKIIEIPKFKLSSSASIFGLLKKQQYSVRPLSMEDMNQGYGFILYRTKVKRPVSGLLKIKELRDYAVISINEKRVSVLDRRIGQDSVEITIEEPNSTLDILVENLGRINYGKKMIDNRKGITEKVMLAGQELTGWEIFALPFDDIRKVHFDNKPISDGPIVRRGTFKLEERGDTYLDMREWGKGFAWINGHNLGRYWYIGPQQTLYVPGPWLRKGENEIIILELLLSGQDQVQGIKAPILNELNNANVVIKGRYDTQKKSCLVNLACEDTSSSIFYTIDGSEPAMNSMLFKTDLALIQTVQIAARAFKKGNPSDFVSRFEFYPSISTGKKIKIASMHSPRYPGGGESALVDGIKGSLNFRDGFWQGYEGVDLDATIDLGESMTITKLTIRLLQENDSWIFLPSQVVYSVSGDGKSFADIGAIDNDESAKKDGTFIKPYALTCSNTKARYIRFLAKNMGVCPLWHKAAGGKAWIFADEIMVE